MLGEALKYGLIGVLNTVLTLAVIFALMHWFGVPPLAANAMGYLVGFANSFVLNRIWVFRSQAPVARSMARFVVSALIAYGLNAAVIHIGVAHAGASKYWIQVVGAVVYTGCLFLLSRMWAFAGSNPRNAAR